MIKGAAIAIVVIGFGWWLIGNPIYRAQFTPPPQGMQSDFGGYLENAGCREYLNGGRFYKAVRYPLKWCVSYYNESPLRHTDWLIRGTGPVF
jgi:hypothetical protein